MTHGAIRIPFCLSTSCVYVYMCIYIYTQQVGVGDNGCDNTRGTKWAATNDPQTMYIEIHVHIHIHIHIRVHVHIHIHIFVHTYTHIYIYVHTNI